MSSTLVLGNGESRLRFAWNIIPSATLVGCNAIHRDTKVDHLICCDRRMVQESVENSETRSTLIYVRESNYHYFRKIKKNKNIKLLPDIPERGQFKRDQPEHWGSGPYAVLVAANLDNKKIILVGFDLYGNNEKINNVYKDTSNYNKSNSNAVDYSFWVHQIAQVFKHYNSKSFTIVNDWNWHMPKEWQQENVNFQSFEEYYVDNKYLCN